MKNKKSAVILVFNDKHELALQLRSASDSSYPMHWDFSAAGGIDDGEHHKQAAKRELKEEIGIQSALHFIKDYLYEDENGTDHLYIFQTLHNGPFTPQIEEVERVEFVNLHKIQEMIDRNEKFHPEFLKLWEQGWIK